MEFLAENEGSKFSPSGILQVVVKVENLIENARKILEELRA